jgi:hypothetical protein
MEMPNRNTLTFLVKLKRDQEKMGACAGESARWSQR